MFNRRCSWNGQHDRRPLQQPGQRNLSGARTVRFRNAVQYFPRNLAGSEWEPGNKSDSVVLTIILHVIPFAVSKTVAVLHRDDRNDFASSLDVLLCDIGQS